MSKNNNEPPDQDPGKVVFLPWATASEIAAELEARENMSYLYSYKDSRGQWHFNWRAPGFTKVVMAECLAEYVAFLLKEAGKPPEKPKK